MAIETKTMYVANDGTYWETEEEAEIRNEELARIEEDEIDSILNKI